MFVEYFKFAEHSVKRPTTILLWAGLWSSFLKMLLFSFISMGWGTNISDFAWRTFGGGWITCLGDLLQSMIFFFGETPIFAGFNCSCDCSSRHFHHGPADGYQALDMPLTFFSSDKTAHTHPFLLLNYHRSCLKNWEWEIHSRTLSSFLFYNHHI